MAATTSEDTAVSFLMRHGLLASSKTCEYCDYPMNLCVSKRGTEDEDRRWRCRRSGHPGKELSLKKGSFFDGTKLAYRTVLRLMFFWASDIPVGTAEQFLGISDVTAIDWYGFCRDICSAEMLQCSMMIGGVGHTVEIDETSLKKKSKFGRGKQHEDYWLFGGVDRATGRWFGIHIMAGSTIISDQFSSYVSVNGKHTLENNKWLKGKNYTHKWVNHDKFFVDPKTGAHTNRIEGTWEVRVKRYIKAIRGVRKERLDQYLDMYLWKSWCFNGTVPKFQYLDGLVQGIRKHYPV
ncbi:hypothetical protein PHYSODRAFT_531350 [Phytophthora sojae]|uniref:ISXO2-like transposase domain-containing protein n=1 Tax=Phytophthora sojae (strain P6497) TaxID=1094619 RepID=G5ADT4_PHYSP|nr:hypothetical protein PHYSODRAFT_531350 [Phytophthora sojae]EGZ06612.1 hypothetical protein PHYSODRAFT_531350 [Phytophthora sojae]|eukprot:XP_009538509.1 hypothetical protein PHYSODRAFT_531350 [Phytophthora sojae]